MKRILVTLTLVLMSLGVTPRAQELPQGAGPTLDWLKGLVLETRFHLQLDGGFEDLRLFHERQADGRSWAQVLVDELGSATDWALTDEAVMLMLGEAEAMRSRAMESAGTANEAKYVNARRAYLETAALLLSRFRGAASDVFEQTIGLLPDLDIPDWILPGEIHIVEAAGAARLNTDTLEFGGRLSGEVRLPKFDATLVVPNASFDSRGNVDFSAYGTASFPPESANKVTLSVLERRPLSLQITERGKFRVAGSGRVALPDGNTFEAYFDVDDPNYEFGLAYSGTVTLKLAKELALLRPTFSTDLTLEAIAGMSDFFGRYGKGLESFLQSSPPLENAGAGVAPDFNPPVISLPFDVVKAWQVAAGHEDVRSALDGSLDTTLPSIKDVLGSLQGEIQSAKRGVAPSLNQVKRLRRHAEAHANLVAIIDRSREEFVLGNEEESAELLARAGPVALEARDAALEYFQGLPADASLDRVINTLRFLIAADRASVATSTEDGQSILDDAAALALIDDKLAAGLALALAEYGLGPEGQISDFAQFARVTPQDLRVLFLTAVSVDRIREVFSTDPDRSGLTEPPITVLPLLEFEQVRTLYQNAITEGDEATRALNAVRLGDLAAIDTVIDFTNLPANEQAMVGAVHETLRAIGGDAGATPESEKLAAKLIDAARIHVEAEKQAISRRVDALMGDGDAERLLPEDVVFNGEEKSFFERWALALTAAADAGLVDAALSGEMKLSLGAVMTAFAESQQERFADGEVVEENLTEAYDALLILADLTALAEDVLPDEADLMSVVESSWQTLHLAWVPLAETHRLHWQLSSYAQAVARAGVQYGDGVAGDLLDSFQNKGMAALDALALVVDDLSGIVDGFLPQAFQFALPGDLEVQRMFGNLRFNRVTGDWDVAFGGRLFLADYDLTFEIPEATLASDGAFELKLDTRGPVPFGFEETLSLTTSFDLIGNALTPSLEMASATGDLIYTAEGGLPITYDMALDYAFVDPPGTHRFDIHAGLTGPQEFFTKEIVIKDTSVDFSLDLDANGQPRRGGAGGDMTLWLLLREEAVDKEVSTLTEDDFYLTFRGAASFEYVNGASPYIEVELTTGDLFLPGELFSDQADPNLSPRGELLGTICVRYEFNTGRIFFCDPQGDEAPGVAFRDMLFDIPGLEGAELEITTAALRFPLDLPLPILEELDARVKLPIPGQDTSQGESSATVKIDVANWPITGLPEEVAISLEEPLTLFNFEQFRISVLANAGQSFEECPGGLSFVHNADTGQTIFRIASGIEVTVDPDMIARDSSDPEVMAGGSSSLTASASGCFTWEVGQLPTFSLGTITFSGRFRIGGENGIEFKGADGAEAASLTLSNVNNLFNRPPPNPQDSFRINLQGAVNFSDIIEFALLDSAFIWDGTTINPLTNAIDNFLPRFEPGGFCAVLGEDGIDLIEGLLPLYPTELCLRFRLGDLPLFPAAGQIGLFDPTNLVVDASGVVTLPNGAAVDGGSPGISGGVEGISIRFERDAVTGFPVPNFVETMASIDALTLRIENLDIPPLGGITGGLHLGNLDKVAAGMPQELFFAGEVGGKINNMGVEILLAAKPLEFVGACFSLSGGPAGIPIDGGTLGGILLTGGSGGINFKNSYSNPCSFESYITFAQNDQGEMIPEDASFPGIGTGDPNRPMNGSPPDVEELNAMIMTDLAAAPVTTNDPLPPPPACILPSSPDFNCITGDFPPATLNPLCERIFVNGEERIIFKGTALTQAEVTGLLAAISPPGVDVAAHLDGLSPGDAINAFVGQLVGSVQASVNRILMGDVDLDVATPPVFDPTLVDARAYQFFSNKVNELFNSIDDSARHFLREAFHQVLKLDPEASLFEILVQKAAEGIPCFDVTLQVSGTLSHSVISSVLSGTGTVTLSSTGTAVLNGSINLVGIPVGDATLAFSLTNENGSIDPSFGGVAEVALGPLEMGRMTMSLGCPGCFDAVQFALMEWVMTNLNLFTGDLGAFLVHMMDVAAPRFQIDTGLRATRNAGLGVLAHFEDMTEEERFAWMSSFLNVFQIVVDNGTKSFGETLDPLPVPVSSQTLEAFLGSFKTLLVKVLTQVNPRLCFGGDIGPKLFGIPLTGGAESAIGGGLLYHRVTDPIDRKDYQEVVAQFKFSPSQILASSVLGSYAFTLPTAIDQAQMGYSLRMEAFTESNIETLLMNPAQFAADQISTLVEDGVLSFGYEIQPLGYQLGKGQGRMIMPRIEGHPLNPNRESSRLNTSFSDHEIFTEVGLDEWVNPDDFGDPSIPTRMEIILAALSKGQLQNPIWRGKPADLASLFSLPSSDCYQPGDGCDLLTQDVAGRIDPSLLAQLDLAMDYFPHGGLIGGAELSLPNMIAEAPPFEQLARLLTPPLDGDFTGWLENAQILFADPGSETRENEEPGFAYFTGTACTGQMALYLPAPNPIGFEWANGSLEDFIGLVQTGDFQGIVDRTLPESFYRSDLILLRGWMETPLLGLPVARAMVDFRPNEGLFIATAAVGNELDGEPNWLFDLVGASIDFQIKAPDCVTASTSMDTVEVGGINDRLEGFGRRVRAQGTAAEGAAGMETLTPSAASDFIAELQASMPKVGLETTATFKVPGELSDLMRVLTDADTGLEARTSFFAFSPAFDLGDPGDDAPYALAKRRGGMGIRSSFQLGYFPPEVDPEQHLVIDVPDASFAMIPDANVGLFPAIAGQGVFTNIQIPGPVDFRGSGLVQFNSSPAVGEDFIQVEGETSPIDLGPFLQVTPLDANADTIAAGLQVTRTRDGARIGLGIDPAQASIPMFGSLTGKIFGGALNHENIDTKRIHEIAARLDETQRFTFSTVEGQPWNAIVRLDGAIEIRSPLDPTGDVLFSAEPVSVNGAPVPFLAQMEGVGIKEFEIRLTIPNGLTFTLFPGTFHESVYTVGDNSATCLIVKSDGTLYFDSGTRNVELVGGLGQLRGRVELVFQPQGDTPTLEYTDPGAVAASLGASNDQTLTISNANPNPSQLIVDASISEPSHFTVTPSRLVLGARESATLTVRFAPRATSFEQPVLRLENNSATPLVELPLEGVVRTQPAVHVDLTAIDFNRTPLGTSKTKAVRVTNVGTASLECTKLTVQNTAFSVEANNFTVAPNQFRDLLVRYAPVNPGAQAGSLEFTTNDPSRERVRVRLNGTGSDRFWYQQRKGTGRDSLQGIAMRSDGRGHAAGLAGAKLFASAGGQHWADVSLTGHPDLQAAAAVNGTTAWIVGATRPLKGEYSAYAARTTNGGANWSRQTAAPLVIAGTTWHGIALIPGTERVVMVGGSPTQARIAVQAGSNDYNLPDLEPEAKTLHGVAFGTETIGLAVGEDRTILRTENGGKSWNLVTNFPKDLEAGTDLFGVAANPFEPDRYIAVGENGTIIGSGDKGSSWESINVSAKENLHGIVRAGGDRYFIVGDRGIVLIGNGRGTTWVTEDAGTVEPFRAVSAIETEGRNVSPQVWAVTAAGSVFHRSATALNGSIGVIEADDLELRAAVGERVVREIRVSNEGTEDLTIGLEVSGDDIEVRPKDTQTVAPGEEIVFLVVITAQASGPISGTISVNASDSALSKETLDVKVDVRDPSFIPRGYAVLPARLDLGTVVVGDTARSLVEVHNIGQAPIEVHSLDVRHNHAVARYAVNRLGAGPIADQDTLSLALVADAPGEYTALLELTSDATNGVAVMEVRARVIEAPQTVLVRTSPPGLNFLLDHDGDGVLTAYSGTTAFSVVDGDPGNNRQLERGTSIQVSALASTTRNGVAWNFQRWRPGGERTFSFTAGNSVSAFIAEYATGPIALDPAGDPLELVAAPCRFDPPADVPFGPWVRVTEARLQVPWLDDGDEAGFRVEGAFFIGLERMIGSLTSSRIVVPAPLVDELEALEITPGSWNLDVDADGLFSLAALTPGLQVLNVSVSPPTELLIEADLSTAAPRASIRFATLDELPLHPGWLAFGPGEVVFETNVSTNNADARLAMDTSLRALTNPTAPGQWLINRPYGFQLAAEVAPLAFTEPVLLADLGLVRLHADEDSVIRPVFAAGTIGLEAENLDLEFFRSESFLDTSAELTSDGAFRFLATLPFNGLDAGPVRVKPNTDVDTVISVEGDPLTAHLALGLPPLALDSSNGLWPNNTVRTTQRTTFDTRNLAIRLPIPDFQFAGFFLPDQAPLDADNYVEFARTSSTGSFRLRHRKDLYLGRMKFAFDANTEGAVSGSLAGEIGIEQPSPFNAFSASLSMAYDKQAEPQFIAHRTYLGVGLRFKVSKGNPIFSQACTLVNGSPEPIDSWDDDICVP